MPGVVSRLAEMGLALPAVTPPLADYVPAVRSGNLVFTAGQLPMVSGQIPATGLVGAGVSPQEAHNMAGIAALNAIAALAGLGIDPDRVTRVVKVVGYVASTADFTGHPAVVNGASALLAAAFGDAGRHARSAVGVASLPLGSPVEVEVIFEIAADS
jgi:enamine deaminase RidA (YjgF/YER057c/UK114 family)